MLLVPSAIDTCKLTGFYALVGVEEEISASDRVTFFSIFLFVI
jgi:hypothetical protein